jgi:hypothetical protein
VVQVAVGPAQRRLDVLVELVEGAVPHLDAPPDRGAGAEQGDPELVKALGGRVRAGAPVMLDDVRGGVEDVPERVLLPPGEGVSNRRPGLLPDRLQLGQGEVDRPRVPLAQLQPAGKLRDDLGNGPALGLGEPDREVLWNGRHRLTPGP